MPVNILLTSIPAAERQRLAPYLEPVEMEFGQVLLEAGQPIRYVYFPHTEVTSTVVHAPDGSMIKVGLMGAEGMVWLSLLLGTERSNTTVIVQIAGAGTRMRANRFIEHVVRSGGDLHLLLLRHTNVFMAMVGQIAACNTLHSVEKRMCRWMLLTHDRVGSDVVPLTHEFLATMLGVRRSGVSVIAGELRDRGLITYTRGQITVLERAGLEASSCKCYKLIVEQTKNILPDATEKRLLRRA